MAKPKDVDSYIADAAPEARPILEELRKLFLTTVPKAEEKISWGVPFYRYHGEIGGFSAFKSHVSVGLSAEALGDDDRAALEAKDYKVLKATLQIRFDQKVPSAAIKRILKAKVKLNEANRST